MESCEPQGQDVEKTWRLPAHARPLETTLNDMLAGPLHGTGPHGESTLPGLLVSDPSPVPLHGADQLGQGVADGLFPGPHILTPSRLPFAYNGMVNAARVHQRHCNSETL